VKRSNKLVWKLRLCKNPLVECVPMFAVVKRFSLGGNEEQHVTFLVATAGGWSGQDERAAGKTMKQTLPITTATITSCVDCLTVFFGAIQSATRTGTFDGTHWRSLFILEDDGSTTKSFIGHLMMSQGRANA
jgi:hypothetical protein